MHNFNLYFKSLKNLNLELLLSKRFSVIKKQNCNYFIKSQVYRDSFISQVYNSIKKSLIDDPDKIEFRIKLIDLPDIDTIKDIPYINQENNRETVWFNIKDIKQNKLEKLIKVLNKPKQLGKKEKSEILKIYKNNKNQKFINTDKYLKRIREITNTDLRGQVILGPGISKLIRNLERLFIEKSLYDFQELFFPKLVSLQTWYTTGHIQKTINQAYYVSRFKTRDPSFSKYYINKYLIDGKLKPQDITNNLDSCIGGMTYAQCPPLWNYFKNKIINSKNLPILVLDKSGPSYRYQGKAIHSITRLDEFHRVQGVFIQENSKLDKIIDILKNRYIKFLNLLELDFRLLKVDSWMTTQNLFVKTYDFEIFLPYQNRYLEVLNLSNNSIDYIKNFKVRSQNCELASGCTGLGLERLAYSYLAQKGFNQEIWPDIIKNLEIVFKSYTL
jgi:seryl-tRNA synthetase